MQFGQQIAVRLDADQLRRLDQAVRAGSYPSRAAAIRAGVALALSEHERRSIEAAYRRGHARHPQAGDDLEWVEQVGAAALADDP